MKTYANSRGTIYTLQEQCTDNNSEEEAARGFIKLYTYHMTTSRSDTDKTIVHPKKTTTSRNGVSECLLTATSILHNIIHFTSSFYTPIPSFLACIIRLRVVPSGRAFSSHILAALIELSTVDQDRSVLISPTLLSASDNKQ